MAFGLSFGSKKNKVDMTTSVDKAESTNQQQTGTTATSGTTQQASTQSNQGTSTNTQTQNTSGASQSQGTSTGLTQQTTSAFSSPVLSAVEEQVQRLLGSTAKTPAVSTFNGQKFIADGMAAATSDLQAGQESAINQLISGVGGAEGSNSMVALLANRLRGDTQSELGGIRSQLTGQAEAISRDNQLAAAQIAATDQGFLGNLLSALKGGQVTTTGIESQTTQQSGTEQQTGTSTANQQTQETATAQSLQTQSLLEQLSQILQGTTTTVGTENQKGTTKEKGGGFSLGL